MYAVIATGGKQYKVAEGDTLEVEKLDADVDASVSLRAILLVDGDDVTTDADALAGATVSATVVEHVKGPKIRIFKYRPKTGYRRKTGHRQQLTRIRVDEITTKTKKK